MLLISNTLLSDPLCLKPTGTIVITRIYCSFSGLHCCALRILSFPGRVSCWDSLSGQRADRFCLSRSLPPCGPARTTQWRAVVCWRLVTCWSVDSPPQSFQSSLSALPGGTVPLTLATGHNPLSSCLSLNARAALHDPCSKGYCWPTRAIVLLVCEQLSL